jgi:hypothetical protein
MPLGHYEVLTETRKAGQKGGASKGHEPGGLTIMDGRTEHTIELGKNLKF